MILLVVSLRLRSHFYRIQAEEEMLETRFGEQYKLYKEALSE
ncbi:hypothetical protein [Calothrix sp. NIES-2100]